MTPERRLDGVPAAFDVGGLADLPPGTLRSVQVAGRWLCVGNDDGHLFALDDACLHRAGSLGGGMLRDGHVTCPLHWWRYDVRTGALAGDDDLRVSTHPVRVAGGRVLVEVRPGGAPRSLREVLREHARTGTAREADVRAVIWDIGGIVYMTPFEVFDEIERNRGLAVGTLPRGPFGTEPDLDYAAVDAGTLPEPAYWRSMRERLLAAGVDIDVHRDIDWTGRERPEVLDVVAALAPRMPQVALTNDATAFLGTGWESTWRLREWVETVLDSVTLGIRKPDPRAYHAAAEAIGVPINACLFVDDLTVNVDAARAAGMPALHFDVTDPRGSANAVLAHALAGSAESRARSDRQEDEDRRSRFSR